MTLERNVLLVVVTLEAVTLAVVTELTTVLSSVVTFEATAPLNDTPVTTVPVVIALTPLIAVVCFVTPVTAVPVVFDTLVGTFAVNEPPVCVTPVTTFVSNASPTVIDFFASPIIWKDVPS